MVIHEIYGINKHIRDICERYAKQGFDVICPNLLASNQVFSYQEEAVAYKSFIQNTGFRSAQRQIENLSRQIRNEYKYSFVIGYSIGATLAWLCSRQEEGLYNGIVCFYGSRIRDYKDIVPACPVLLFFPQKEEAFDITGLIQELSAKEDINIVQVNALHGFADPWSGKYCYAVSEAAFRKTISFIKKTIITIGKQVQTGEEQCPKTKLGFGQNDSSV
jgi:dienelactone hydrolase